VLSQAQTCVNLTTPASAYTQNFDTLATTGIANTLLPTGWLITESGTSARNHNDYAADTGGSNTGDTFSYGSAASTDRAFGTLRSGTLIPVIGACFINNTGVHRHQPSSLIHR